MSKSNDENNKIRVINEYEVNLISYCKNLSNKFVNYQSFIIKICLLYASIFLFSMIFLWIGIISNITPLLVIAIISSIVCFFLFLIVIYNCLISVSIASVLFKFNRLYYSLFVVALVCGILFIIFPLAPFFMAIINRQKCREISWIVFGQY